MASFPSVMTSPTTTPGEPSPAEIPAQYDARETEPSLYEAWERAELFHADAAASRRAGGPRDPFTIVIPPPNVTAVLHVGHGLNGTVQDVLVRWRRMAGDEALWVPGTDHAGIATQNVVEKAIAAEGHTRFDLGRDAFVERVRTFADDTRGQILNQLREIGSSADWRRTAYTFSPELSRAVREVFVRLFDDGLIYRGHRVIHWCPRCLTSLSDEEAEFEPAAGTLYHVRYKVADDDSASVVVATTRPETILGDVAVAVHPDDDRYTALHGRQVRLPITGLVVPVITDAYVDRQFGTGVLKITPAHDANDFDVARRHALPMPVVMAPNATMAEGADAAGRVPGDLVGLDREVARARIVQQLRAAGLLVREEPHQHAVRHCYRCHTVVEPRLSDQWFVKIAPLAAPALEVVRDGRIRLLPERHVASYVHWMENIRDWNISRQIWWGHRIPVWRCDSCGVEKAYREAPAACHACGAAALTQDPDVLDTWFSSWLWPVSTLGWPDESHADLRAFYPTDVLVTAPEILFLWVARMIMSGMYLMGRVPFHTVYLTGTVRDLQHRKMSKSVGNGIDPLDVVHTYGADALRWTLVQGMGLGVDVMLDPADLEKSFAPGRNFATKLWNIGRFLLLSVGGEPVRAMSSIGTEELTLADCWILHRLRETILECDAALGRARPPGDAWPVDERNAGMRLDAFAEAARRFVWNEFADWYVEATKDRLQRGKAQGGAEDGRQSGSEGGSAAEHQAGREVARAVLVHVFDQAMRLLHPVMPYITETLWQRLPMHVEGTFLAAAAWPQAEALPQAEANSKRLRAEPGHIVFTGNRVGPDTFDLVREAIGAIRQLRSDYAIPPGHPLRAHVVTADPALRAALLQESAFVRRLTRTDLDAAGAPAGAAAHAVLSRGVEIVLPLAGAVDLEKECARLRAARADRKSVV